MASGDDAVMPSHDASVDVPSTHAHGREHVTPSTRTIVTVQEIRYSESGEEVIEMMTVETHYLSLIHI